MKKKNIILLIVAIIGTIAFFSYKPVITYDSSHYLWLSTLIGSKGAFCDWDVARGIVFPIIIKIFTYLLGENSYSLSIAMYIAYVIMLIVSFKIYKENVKTKSKIQNIIISLLYVIMIVLNPMIFGYYHVLLTEFIGITVAVLYSYLSWKFIDMDFCKNRKKFIFYTISFCIGAMLMWQLKQPYVGTVIFPLIVASLISIIKNFKRKNIIQKIVVCFITIISIGIGIFLWNTVLKSLDVKVEETRTSSGFLTNQLINGASSYRMLSKQEQRYTKQAIEKDEYIEDVDKKELYKVIDGTSEKYKSFLILEKYKSPGEVLKKKVIFSSNESFKILDAAKYVKDTFIESPGSVIKNVIDNYLTIANIYKLEMVNNVFYIGKDNIKLGTICENGIIGYRPYNYGYLNVFPVSPELQTYVDGYSETQKPIIAVNFIMQRMEPISTILFKFAIAILPLYLVFLVTIRIVVKKKYSDDFKKTLDLCLVLASYSFLHIMLHVVLAAIIDRYAMPTTVTLYISYILAIYLLINLKKYKRGEGFNNEKM